MKTLYLDCSMGAAGDMLASALMELLPEQDSFIERFNALSIPKVVIEKEKSVKCGITGTHISVKVDDVEEDDNMYEHHHEHENGDHVHEHEHHHEHENEDHVHEHEHHHEHENGDRVHEHEHHHEHENGNHVHEHEHHHHHTSMYDIEHIVSCLDVSEKVKKDVLAVYNLIAEAESHAHGKPVTKIHFHEVGTMDAIADVTMVCMLMEELAPDKIIVSPIHVGSGQVKCAHGILPVPAPATAYILKDVPIYGGKINGELCTPTGAALLKYFANDFGGMPVMKTHAIGYGMGKKDFEAANCVRAMLGEAEDKTDVVLELSCNVDDMTAEEISFATEKFFDGGALEVYTIPIGMKKTRPGTLIRVMCIEDIKEKMIELIFKYTSTIGVRESETKRYVLDRKIEKIESPYGEVRKKISSGYGVKRCKYEYEDLAHIAREQNISIEDVKKMIEE